MKGKKSPSLLPLRVFALILLIAGLPSPGANGQAKASALDRANEMASAGNYPQAYALYETALKEDPGNIEVYVDYAWNLFAGGRTGDAIAVALNGYDRDPEHLMLLEEFALFCVDGGYPDEAAKLIEEIIRLIPDVRTCMEILYDIYDSEETSYGSYGACRAVRELYVKKIAAAYPRFPSDFEKYREARRLLDSSMASAGEGDVEREIAYGEKAMKLFAAIGDEGDEADTAIALGSAYQDLGQDAKAIPLLVRALRIFDGTLGPEHPELAELCSTLARLYRGAGENEKAEPLFRRALEIGEKSLEPGDPVLVGYLNDLMVLYNDLKEWAKAEPLCRKSLQIYEKALGPDHPDVASMLVNLAVLYQAMGDDGKAEPLFLRALAIQEKALKPEDPQFMDTLNTLASLYRKARRYAKAEPLYLRALSLREKALGPANPDLVVHLNRLAGLYSDMEDYAKAEPLYLRALAIREKAFGGEASGVANSLSNLALLYYYAGEYRKAEPLYLRALAILEKTQGREHLDVAVLAGNFAQLYGAMGEYGKAEALYLRALEIREKALGPDHPDLARSLTDLAEQYRTMGAYAKAEPLLRRALSIQEKAPGPGQQDLASTINSLASLYSDLGDYAKAEPLYRRALEIRERILGPDHSDTAILVNDLAVLYQTMEDYGKAEPLYLRALAISEKILGPDHPDGVKYLNNLAMLYHATGDYAKARPLYLRALDVWETALGPDHPNVADALNNLGGLYHDTGDYANAELLYLRALAISEKALGPGHADLAVRLNNLAGLYFSMADYAKAEDFYGRALKIQEKALGPSHPLVAGTLFNLAFLDIYRRRFASALDRFQKGLSIQDGNIRNIFLIATERQKLNFIKSTGGAYFACLSIINLYMRQDRDAVRFAFELVLRRKGIVLEAQSRANEALRGRLSESARIEWDALASLNSSLSRLLLNGPAGLSEARYLEKISSMQSQVEEREKKLSDASALIAADLRQRKAAIGDVAKALPSDASLVEFVKVPDFNISRLAWTEASRYLAFVLKPGGEAALVDLGDIEPDARNALDAIRASMDDPYGELVPQSILSLTDLYGKVWAPLENLLGGAKKILLSPDGTLNLVPFAALQDASGKALLERYAIGYLTSGRELAGGGGERARAESGLLLVADPAFDGTPGLAATREGSAQSRAFAAEFGPLPGTAEEAREVFALVSAGKGEKKVLTGLEATKTAVKSAKSPRILHLATHGFFLPDEEVKPGGIGLQDKGGGSYGNPLARSGLAFAGANRAAEAEEGDDGILTALEISGMDLWGTELVVLSACETALGSVEVGEGVFGLRRSFGLAGAKALLMSLWPVSDAVTMEQMKEFYRGLDGKGAAEALRDAQLATLRKLRAQGADADPAVWAPFIIQGADVLGPSGKANSGGSR